VSNEERGSGKNGHGKNSQSGEPIKGWRTKKQASRKTELEKPLAGPAKRKSQRGRGE
jgi:hypothetical protein